MGATMVLLEKILEMFVLMAGGFFLYRKKLLTDAGTGDISKLLTNVVIPVILIDSLWGGRSTEKTAILAESALLSVALMAVSVAIALLLFRRDGVSASSAAFSNVGFIGIPLVQNVLGAGAVVYISMMAVAVAFLQYTVGLVMITGDRSRMQPRAVGKNMVVISVLLGVVLYGSGLPKPALVSSIFSTLGGVNTPMATFLLGVYLAKPDLKKVFTVASNYWVSAVRLLVAPMGGLAVIKFLPLGSADMKLALVLTAACPAGSLGAIFAQQYGGDYEKATGQVCISTLLCLAGLPIVTAVCERVL